MLPDYEVQCFAQFNEDKEKMMPEFNLRDFVGDDGDSTSPREMTIISLAEIFESFDIEHRQKNSSPKAQFWMIWMLLNFALQPLNSICCEIVQYCFGVTISNFNCESLECQPQFLRTAVPT